MRIAGTTAGTTLALWLGLLGAPLAWTGQLIFGFGVEEADCNAAGRHWALGTTWWEVGLTVAAGAVALAGIVAAARVWRSTRRGDLLEAAGLVPFLAAGGVLVSFVFGALILLGGVAAIVLEPCSRG